MEELIAAICFFWRRTRLFVRCTGKSAGKNLCFASTEACRVQFFLQEFPPKFTNSLKFEISIN